MKELDWENCCCIQTLAPETVSLKINICYVSLYFQCKHQYDRIIFIYSVITDRNQILRLIVWHSEIIQISKYVISKIHDKPSCNRLLERDTRVTPVVLEKV